MMIEPGIAMIEVETELKEKGMSMAIAADNKGQKVNTKKLVEPAMGGTLKTETTITKGTTADQKAREETTMIGADMIDIRNMDLVSVCEESKEKPGKL